MAEVREPRERRPIPWRLICEALVAVLAVVFLLQNSESTKVEFLFVHATVNLWLIILVSMVLGAVVALSVNAHRLKRRPKPGRPQH